MAAIDQRLIGLAAASTGGGPWCVSRSGMPGRWRGCGDGRYRSSRRGRSDREVGPSGRGSTEPMHQRRLQPAVGEQHLALHRTRSARRGEDRGGAYLSTTPSASRVKTTDWALCATIPTRALRYRFAA